MCILSGFKPTYTGQNYTFNQAKVMAVNKRELMKYPEFLNTKPTMLFHTLICDFTADSDGFPVGPFCFTGVLLGFLSSGF